MRINVSSYIPGTSAVHACDARVKIVLLAAYSVTLFLVRSWMGLGLCALLFVTVAHSGAAVLRFARAGVRDRGVHRAVQRVLA